MNRRQSPPSETAEGPPPHGDGVTLHAPRLLVAARPDALDDRDPLLRLTVDSGSDAGLAETATDAPELVRQAASRLRERVRAGAFTRLPEPATVVYRLTAGGHQQTGVVVEVAVDDYRAGRVRRHEATRPDRERQLASFLATAEVELVPVTLAYASHPALRELLEQATAGEPAVHLVSDDGVAQTVWTVDTPELVRAIQGELAGVETLYIADGHHRMAAADRFARHTHTSPAANPPPGIAHLSVREEHASQYVLGALFPADEMRVLGYHRCVTRPEGVSAPDLLQTLTAQTDVIERIEQCASDEDTRPAPGIVPVYVDEQWYRMWLRTPGDPDPRASLDVVALDEGILGPALGIADIETDPRVTHLPGSSDAADVARWCAEHRAIGFLLHPPGVEQITAVADAGLLMPPKSTWFDPKARAGPFLRDLR